jgi:hypothetical protein
MVSVVQVATSSRTSMSGGWPPADDPRGHHGLSNLFIKLLCPRASGCTGEMSMRKINPIVRARAAALLVGLFFLFPISVR